jgi:hypothetical protein
MATSQWQAAQQQRTTNLDCFIPENVTSLGAVLAQPKFTGTEPHFSESSNPKLGKV